MELPLAQMTVAEKLRTLELLWSDLCRDEQNIPVPQWHKDLLDERERLVREGKAQFEDWETAKARIAKRARES
ncbi:MAG: addiction module protein [Verrucomicrobiales bacterium]|nr:addiction module protein [Verrucomicrobiales bacterium]